MNREAAETLDGMLEAARLPRVCGPLGGDKKAPRLSAKGLLSLELAMGLEPATC